MGPSNLIFRKYTFLFTLNIKCTFCYMVRAILFTSTFTSQWLMAADGVDGEVVVLREDVERRLVVYVLMAQFGVPDHVRSDRFFYVGSTNNFARRCRQHAACGKASTARGVISSMAGQPRLPQLIPIIRVAGFKGSSECRSFEMLVQRLDDNAEQRDAFARAFKRRQATYTELRMGGYKRSVLKLNSMTKDEAVELAITRVNIAIRSFKSKF